MFKKSREKKFNHTRKENKNRIKTKRKEKREKKKQIKTKRIKEIKEKGTLTWLLIPSTGAPWNGDP